MNTKITTDNPTSDGGADAIRSKLARLSVIISNFADAKVQESAMQDIKELRRHVAELQLERDNSASDAIDVRLDLLELTEEFSNLQQRHDALRKALEEISDPLKFIRERAEAEGLRIDGTMAVRLIENPNYFRQIADAALREGEQV